MIFIRSQCPISQHKSEVEKKLRNAFRGSPRVSPVTTVVPPGKGDRSLQARSWRSARIETLGRQDVGATRAATQPRRRRTVRCPYQLWEPCFHGLFPPCRHCDAAQQHASFCLVVLLSGISNSQQLFYLHTHKNARFMDADSRCY